MSTRITELAPATVLDTDDRFALKNADNWTLHCSPFHGSTIHAHARGGFASSERIWTPREQLVFNDTRALEYGSRDRMRVINVDTHAYGYGVNDAGERGFRWDPSSGIDTMPSCFASDPSIDVRNTVAESLRNGDTLTLSWVADNNNQYVNAAGLHVDEVRLIVVREVKGTRKKHTYKLVTSVCQDNTARMIRRFG